MSISEDSKIVETRARLLEGMREYMAEDDVEYTEADVTSCDGILEEFLGAITSAEAREDALLLVKKAVLALNDLNEKCDDALIETDQREDICAILIRAGEIRGFNAANEDVTEEWREW